MIAPFSKDAAAGLCKHLLPILQYELHFGNAIESQGESDWEYGTWRLVVLARPFHKRWRSSLLRRYVHVHDPHYWEDEYNCRWHKHCLAAAWQTARGCGRRPRS